MLLLILCVGNQIQMCVKDNAYAGEDVHTGGVLALFNAGEVGGINAC